MQRRNLLESARPELALEGWSRRPGPGGATTTEIISFKKITNVGKGVAFRVVLYTPSAKDSRAAMSFRFVPIVAAGETVEIDGEIWVFWQSATGFANLKFIPITVGLVSIDSTNRRHETRYQLAVYQPLHLSGANCPVAPGVDLHARGTVVSRVKWLKFKTLPGRLLTPLRRVAVGVTDMARNLRRQFDSRRGRLATEVDFQRPRLGDG